MEKLITCKVYYGMAATVLSVVCVTLVFSFMYVFLLGKSEQAIGMDMLGLYLFVGGTSVTAAVAVAVLTLFFIGIPLYGAAVSKKITRHHSFIFGGVLTSLILCMILFLYHSYVEPLMKFDFYFGLLCIIFACPIGASVFWRVVRPDRIYGHSVELAKRE